MARDTKILVVDSSIIIKWLNYTDEPHLPQAQKLLDHLETNRVSVYVPELVKYEIGNALLKGKQLLIPEAEDALDAFSKLPLHIIPAELNHLIEIYKLAERLTMTFYDASFVHLAQLFRAPLVTDNPKHQKKVEEVKVIALEKY